jgi:DNA polymerase IV
VFFSSVPEAVSLATPFGRHDRAACRRQLRGCARVAEDLTRKGYLGRTISIKLRLGDIRIVTRDLTVPAPTADAAAIQRAATEFLKRLTFDRKFACFACE